MALKKIGKKTDEPKKPTLVYSEKELAMMASQYAEISAQIKTLEETKKNLADKIKQGAEQIGVKDDKGSFYLESEEYIMGKVASKTMKIDQEKAVATLEKKGLYDCVAVVTTKTVDEKKLEQAVASNKITLDEVEAFTNITTSYKVSVTKKEAMPEVEQSNLAVASKKSKK